MRQVEVLAKCGAGDASQQFDESKPDFIEVLCIVHPFVSITFFHLLHIYIYMMLESVFASSVWIFHTRITVLYQF